MLARKANYFDYQNSRLFPAQRTGEYYKTRIEDRRFSRVLARTFFLIGVVGVLLLTNVALSAITTNYGYNLMQEKQQVQQLYNKNEILRLDIAKMESPDRIYSMATQKLGMVAPTQVLYGPSYTKSSVGAHADT